MKRAPTKASLPQPHWLRWVFCRGTRVGRARTDAVITGPGSTRGLLWRVPILLIGLMLTLSFRTKAAEKPVVQEYQLKAALVMKLPLFVEWPSPSSPPARDELIIGILGSNPFGNHLEIIANNKLIAGHKVVIRACQNLEEARVCHLVFVAESEKPRQQEILTALQKLPVLTVSDLPGFATGGGMVGLVSNNRKISLEINQQALRVGGLKVDPQLLPLARVIDSGTGAATEHK